MRDKTNSMNREAVGEGSVSGYEKLSTADVATWRDRKNRQEKWSGLYGNEAMNFCEGTEQLEELNPEAGGFLQRNNYQDRF